MAHIGPSHDLLQTHAVEKVVNLLAEILPQLVGEARLAVLTVLLAAASGGIHPFVYRRLESSGHEIVSFGADGVPGGTGHDEDLVEAFER